LPEARSLKKQRVNADRKDSMEIIEFSHFLCICENQNEAFPKMKYQKIYGGQSIYRIKENGIIIKVPF